MELTRELSRVPTALLQCRFANFALREELHDTLHMTPPPPLTVGNLPFPDSAHVRRALDLVQEVSPAFLLNHCARTYLFARALATRGNVRADLEVVCLASLMHDLGLTDRFRGSTSFELVGAHAAHDHLVEHRYPADRAALVHEAIALHAAVGLASEREPEIALVHLGAGMDVIGAHAAQIAASTVAAIVAEWPRLGFKERFTALLAVEVQRLPNSHIAGHYDLGFAQRIFQTAVFAE